MLFIVLRQNKQNLESLSQFFLEPFYIKQNQGRVILICSSHPSISQLHNVLFKSSFNGLVNIIPCFMGSFNQQLFIQLGNCVFVLAQPLGMEKLCFLAGVDAYLNIFTYIYKHVSHIYWAGRGYISSSFILNFSFEREGIS